MFVTSYVIHCKGGNTGVGDKKRNLKFLKLNILGILEKISKKRISTHQLIKAFLAARSGQNFLLFLFK